MIALLSETSGERFLPALLDKVMQSAEGRKLMIDRPRITTQSVDMEYLRSLKPGTFGEKYTQWLDWCRVGPDTRAQVSCQGIATSTIIQTGLRLIHCKYLPRQVQYITDPSCAYLMQRYRESHDFYHMICSMPVSTLGETVVKIFEFAHFGLPVALLSSIAGPLRLSNEDRWLLINELGPWAYDMGVRSREKSKGTLLAVRWEERWEMDFNEMRKELGISDPPVQVRYDVKRGFGGKKRAWTTTTVQKAKNKQAANEHTTQA